MALNKTGGQVGVLKAAQTMWACTYPSKGAEQKSIPAPEVRAGGAAARCSFTSKENCWSLPELPGASVQSRTRC